MDNLFWFASIVLFLVALFWLISPILGVAFLIILGFEMLS